MIQTFFDFDWNWIFYWLIDFQMINQKKNIFPALLCDYTPWIIEVRNNWCTRKTLKENYELNGRTDKGERR